jgi:putative glycosyltransferase (TIGR04372 family)
MVLMLTGRRILQLTRTDRIGHLVGEIDCVLKEDRLKPRRAGRAILLAPRDRVANRHVLKYWSKYLTVIDSPMLCRMLEPVVELGFARYRDDMSQYFTAIEETAKYNEIFSAWGERAPLLELAAEDVERGEAALRQMGLAEDTRFVCFHSRDAGYSPEDEHWHSYRNASIESYLPAMTALHEHGLYGMRMGDPTMLAMPATEGQIDYARSPLRSDWLDVFLCARCEFFLGSSSGLYLISTAFGRPSALANLAPMSSALGGGPRELGIPKLLWHETEGRLLSFPEIFSSPVANYRFADQYAAAGIRAPENDPQDIKALALEMLDRTRGVAEYDADDKVRQAKFRALFRPGHYGYGSAASVGRDFLRRYSHLLD